MTQRRPLRALFREALTVGLTIALLAMIPTYLDRYTEQSAFQVLTLWTALWFAIYQASPLWLTTQGSWTVGTHGLCRNALMLWAMRDGSLWAVVVGSAITGAVAVVGYFLLPLDHAAIAKNNEVVPEREKV